MRGFQRFDRATELHAEELAGRVEDLLVHFSDPFSRANARCRSAPWGGRTRECSRAGLPRRRSPPDRGSRLSGRAPSVPGIIAENGHFGSRRGSPPRTPLHARSRRPPRRSAHVAHSRSLVRARSRPPRRRIGADPHAERLDDLCFVRVGEHRHLVAALGTRVDDRQRAAIGRDRRSAASSGCRRGRRGTSWVRLQAWPVAHGNRERRLSIRGGPGVAARSGQVVEQPGPRACRAASVEIAGSPAIAVPCKLGIERVTVPRQGIESRGVRRGEAPRPRSKSGLMASQSRQ
jgi:hypothetical protein